MTDPAPTFLDALTPEDRDLYSLNFLFAAFSPFGEDAGRSLAYLHRRVPSTRHATSHFTPSSFYKPVSSPLGRFQEVVRDEG